MVDFAKDSYEDYIPDWECFDGECYDWGYYETVYSGPVRVTSKMAVWS